MLLWKNTTLQTTPKYTVCHTVAKPRVNKRGSFHIKMFLEIKWKHKSNETCYRARWDRILMNMFTSTHTENCVATEAKWVLMLVHNRLLKMLWLKQAVKHSFCLSLIKLCCRSTAHMPLGCWDTSFVNGAYFFILIGYLPPNMQNNNS